MPTLVFIGLYLMAATALNKILKLNYFLALGLSGASGMILGGSLAYLNVPSTPELNALVGVGFCIIIGAIFGPIISKHRQHEIIVIHRW